MDEMTAKLAVLFRMMTPEQRTKAEELTERMAEGMETESVDSIVVAVVAGILLSAALTKMAIEVVLAAFPNDLPNQNAPSTGARQ